MLSILFCVYNADEFIKESLDSIKSQHLDELDLEIVIVNDGSTDSSESIIKDFISENKKKFYIKYVSHENKGLTKSLNLAISMAEGKYIARMDADDISHPRRFLESIEFLEKNKLDLLSTKSTRFYENKEYSSIPKINANKIKINPDLMKFGNPFVHGSFFGKREVFINLKYDEEYRTAQDYDFLCRAFNAGYKIGYLNKELYKLRIDINSSGRNVNSKQSENAKFIVKKHFKTDRYLLINYKGIKRIILSLYKRFFYER
ncbi:glycosyltransferase family 2 protein [Aliivibrio fischeri]|uniref:glycosyltransferase family 2 protein n=1 Tax=Aliivibrio fischeri TaxID=668 RepID=UPI001F35E558|nr:glycosyltransferase [Aliivibrio fischeri]MCE4935520.1 glycosyltransferase [Aliivibrio fischeri]